MTFRRCTSLPCIIKAQNTYYLFCTGGGDRWGLLPFRTSNDLVSWSWRGSALAQLPDWAQTAVPGTRSAWAPDISFFNGRFHLYYALSSFGSDRVGDRPAHHPTLDPQAAGFGWTDEGIVIKSRPSDDFNAIDPNLLIDTDGKAWLCFGSFWSGLKMIEIDASTGKPATAKPQVRALAQRHAPDAIEASFVIARAATTTCSLPTTSAAVAWTAAITPWSAARRRPTAPTWTGTGNR